VPGYLTELPAGHQFPTTTFEITTEMARAYRAATGDGQDAVYAGSGAVPPLAVAALALGEMLRHVHLPEGSLHASETVEAKRLVPEGATVSCEARLAQRSVRGGYVWSVLETVLSVGGDPALTARATVLSPAEPEPEAAS
jgi:hypothetical protein